MTNMKRDEAIREACEIMSLTYNTIGDFSKPSDGFCDECCRIHGEPFFQNSGEALTYVRRAVLFMLSCEYGDEAIRKAGFDPETGHSLPFGPSGVILPELPTHPEEK